MKFNVSSPFCRGLGSSWLACPGAGCLRGVGRSRAGGFTLVEVVLALGIIACAFVPIMGLLPLGLDFSRQAMDATVGAQVVQQLTSDCMQTDFSQLDRLNDEAVSYYDNQGSRWSGGVNEAVYAAWFVVSSSTKLPAGVDTAKLKTVTISILNTKVGRTDAGSGLRGSRDAKKFVLLIPDNGR